MTICNDLRQAVLQAAMQGNLTEQLSTDSSVDELLAAIAAEKEELIKQKKSKKEKPLAPISEDEIPFDIPENWRWVRLGNIGDTNIGLTYKPTDISKDGTPVLRSSNIQNNAMDYTDLVCVSCNIPERAIICKGDILICVRNGSRKLVGKSAIVDKDGMSFGAFMAKFHSQYNVFINYFLQSPLFREKLDGVKTETINQITQDMLKNQIMPFPPIEEQQRIVDKVEELMAKIDEMEKTEQTLESIKSAFPDDMKAAILQAAMQGKLSTHYDTDDNASALVEVVLEERKNAGKLSTTEPVDIDDCDIPNYWNVIRAGQCLGLLDGKKVTDVKLPYLEAKYLRGSKAAEHKTSGKFVQRGENVILVDGENSGEVFTLNEDGILGSTFKVLFLPTCMNKQFLLYFLEQHRGLLRNNKRGAAIPHLNKELFNNLVLPIPPLAEQQRIVEKLDKLLPLCDNLSAL